MHVASEDISKMTFRMSYGHYEFVKTPIDLSNAPVAFVNTV